MPTNTKTEKKRWEPQDTRFLKHHGDQNMGYLRGFGEKYAAS
jgi:hypothetical protein